MSECWLNPKSLIVLPITMFAACAHRQVSHPEPITTPLEVAVPVATGCVPPNLAAPPEYPDTDAAIRGAADAAARYQLVYAGRKVRIARLNEIEPVVAGCPKAQPK